MKDEEINKAIHNNIFGKCTGDGWCQKPCNIQGCELPCHCTLGAEDFNYCNSIEQAFKVVEKLAKDFYCVMYTPFLKGEFYRARFTRYNTQDDYPASDLESLPKAICLAALKTIEK